MITIRPLEEGDAAELALIEQECFSQPWSEKSFRDLLTHSYCRYLVAVADGKIAGFCGYTNLGGEADIDHVFVAPAYRRQQIADRLMQETLKMGKEEGVEAFTLEVRVSNIPAIRLYEKYDFVSEGIRPRFYEFPTEDAMIMWRR